ncbi:MAG: pyridoxamine 5'-phosphate oxidase [Pseudomonadota bacterium]
MQDNLYLEAIDTLRQWVEEAREAGEVEPTAMTLSTVNEAGQPSARVVLLKALDADGPVFYTNLHSRKGGELRGQPKVALCFYFTRLDRQVRVEGTASIVSDEQADAYFASRDRGSQLGAWASQQSQPLAARQELEDRIASLDQQYEGQPVPRPPHWSGVRVTPVAMEVWQGRAHRVHERWRYEAGADGWRKSLLQP